ncbi:MAG TPA: cytochrome c1 [Rhodospirillaceae bacterium]|nr:cytochrome c1 [Alphaproteobacteria bacterium]OUT41474.1 MAG: cytochrome c1 [Micavibrio sp. TMED2]HCI48120.1 cytochrome c1 [Rhodospirillaceae bacterium]MAS46974.1 cytochrome c1 [Alphaproteobacteria bacterium]MAX95068.1 cytochrome c1 [Alphaproteobacteria bacterium]|tara:strand:- start:15633 stop:16427 length:795 start_codon:yes stop_codon:yes gene_type:complete
MRFTTTLAAAFAVTLGLSGMFMAAPASAAGEEVHAPEVDFSFDGPFGTYDMIQLQRGFQVYRDVCSGCHSMSLLSYRNLGQLGFTEEEVRAIASNYTVTDGPNDEGEMFERAAEPKDRFVSPFANEAAARYANGGALPPDMSLLAKARPMGPEYIHGVLIGYHDAPAGVTVPEGMYYNEYFPGHMIAMAPPLLEGAITYKGLDGEEDYAPSVEEMAEDVSAFLMWAAEPNLNERKQTGVKVILFLIVFTCLMYAVKRRIWADAH